MTEFHDIVYEVDDPVATITINRPSRLNALTYNTLRELRRAVDQAAADPAVVGIVITGEGRAFCAGLDADTLAGVADSAEQGAPPPAGERKGLVSYLTQVPKPVIAAVNGVTAGGGYVLAAMCDLRFASPEARFTTVFSKRGLVAEHGTAWITPRLVGVGNALDLLWSSRMVDADEAYRMGLVERLIDGNVVEAAKDYVRELAATVSPSSLADTKQMVWEHSGLPIDASLDDVWEIQAASLERPDLAEGVASFLEKRPPKFPRLEDRS